jgi:predicted nucleic acid-binding protein
MASESSVCCDANLVVRSHEPESLEHDKIIALFEKWAAEGVDIIAPRLLAYEVTNAVYRAAREGRSSFDRARTVLESLATMPIRFVDDSRLLPDALEIARQLDKKAAYDAHYLALAKREGIVLYTADRRLADSSKGRFTFVRDVMET